jgi:hypothetical protein
MRHAAQTVEQAPVNNALLNVVTPMGLSFEMSFLGGLDTERLAKHLRAVYSLLKC